MSDQPKKKKPRAPKKGPNFTVPTLESDELLRLKVAIEKDASLDERQKFVLNWFTDCFLILLSSHRNTLRMLLALRRMFFGRKSESDKDRSHNNQSKSEKKSRKGRNKGSEDYPGAEKVECNHPTLKAGDICPNCHKGTLVETERRETQIVDGGPPLSITLFLLQRFFCDSCYKIFTAPLPNEQAPVAQDLSKPKKAAGSDAASMANSGPEDDHNAKRPLRLYTIASIVALLYLRFLAGVPHYRLAKIMTWTGMPLSPSTQWDALYSRLAPLLYPLYEQLRKKAAQQPLLINDDTRYRILEHERKTSPPEPEQSPDKKDPKKHKKRAVYGSAIVAKGEVTYCLFETSQGHAGDLIGSVLAERDAKDTPILQMADALSSNQPKGYDGTIIRGKCMDHARRKFHQYKESFPKEWAIVNPLFKAMYQADKHAQKQGMNQEERLSYHQAHSQKPFDELVSWCENSLNQHKIEPNCRYGEAVKYVLNHKKELGAFLVTAGMPMSSAAVERLIKNLVLNRKNSLQYKTQEGADFGDAVLSLAMTCTSNHWNPLKYFEEILKNPEAVMKDPADWLPEVLMRKTIPA